MIKNLNTKDPNTDAHFHLMNEFNEILFLSGINPNQKQPMFLKQVKTHFSNILCNFKDFEEFDKYLPNPPKLEG